MTPRNGFTLHWHFDAPCSAVWRAWTDPSHLGWFFNDEFPVPDEPIELDLRVGGAWRQMMAYTATEKKFAGGIYRVIEPESTLEFAFGAFGGWPELADGGLDDAAIVHLAFEQVEDGTELTLDVDLPERMDHASIRELLGAMRAGWTATVERLTNSIGLEGMTGIEPA